MAAPRHEDDKNYYIYNQYGDNTMKPIGPIGLIAHNLASDFSDSVNFFLRNRRAIYVNNHLELAATPGFMRSDYRIAVNTPRFTSGEGKAIISQTVRGHDLFIITDVLNRSSTYTRFSQETEMSPDEHYQDLIRIILAVTGHARRINVIMPYLYEGRQYRRNARESLDCAAMLKYLFSLGVQNLITFDAHDGRVANAVPRMGFENIQSAYQIIESMIHVIDDLRLDKEHFMVISPDETGLSRAMYYASMFEVPLGTFYRKRNYQVNVDGNYQVVGQAFLGDDVRGLDCLIIDDMIVTGQTVLRVASDLKSRGARRVFVAVTFAQFTSGIDAFHQAHAEGIIDRIFSTNLIYRPPELLAAPWFVEADASRFVALLIDAINHDASLSKLVTPTEKIQKLLDYYRRRNG
ncbi:MAG: ribose-phosphate pyrophosphokinase [Eubacteriales bacterium]|nr:ribose-phosphate pyrophosphokinase [Eubacteriales bacterium]